MLQDGVLAPYLFIVVIQWVMRTPNIDDLGFTTHKHQSSKIPEKRVGDTEYIDDIGLLENAKDKAQKQLDALSRVICWQDKCALKNIKPKPEITLDETVLEMVDDFQNLGA